MSAHGEDKCRKAPSYVSVRWLWGAVSGFSGFVLFLAFTGALFRMHLGLRGLVGGIVFGTVFG